MSEELEYETFSKRMHAEFPAMFSKPYGGFAVGEGWYDIIESLCANIQNHMEWKNRESQVVPQVIVEQIKEKFGGLRFYYQGGDDTISGMVRMAEAWASHSCETCGNKGIRRSGGWIRTLCDTHEEERQLIMNERKENV
jgi:hypothetical protein